MTVTVEISYDSLEVLEGETLNFTLSYVSDQDLGGGILR